MKRIVQNHQILFKILFTAHAPAAVVAHAPAAVVAHSTIAHHPAPLGAYHAAPYGYPYGGWNFAHF